MLAAVKVGPSAADILEVPRPEPGPGEVLVRVRACGICASDLAGWSAPVSGPGTPGRWNADNPGITGHEVSGDIAGVGTGVDTARVGEAVWIDPIVGCGDCEHCRAGRQTLCGRVSIVCQGFAEYVVAPARQCRPIPPGGFDYVTASLIPDMVGTPIAAVNRAGIRPGEAVAVWGLGPVGLGLAQAALIAGASLVIGIDPVPSRRARAHTLGIEALDAGPSSLEQVRERTAGTGPDVVLCSVAGEGVARQAYEALRLGGRMVTVSGTTAAGGQTRKWVSGSWGCDECNWPQVLDDLVERRFVLDDYVTNVFPLDRIEEAFALRADDLDGSFKVVIGIDPPSE